MVNRLKVEGESAQVNPPVLASPVLSVSALRALSLLFAVFG